MSETIDIGGMNELNDGEMKAVTVHDREVLVAKVGGSYYAIDNICPHLKGKLAEGTLEEFIVTCPKHGSRFDIRNGKNVRWLKGSGVVATLAKMVKPPHSVTSYPVEVKDNKILLEY